MSRPRPVEVVVDRLAAHGCSPRPRGDSWAARCPAHDDRKPSLSVSSGDAHRALIHCHAGCDLGDVLGTLGLTDADLFDHGSDRSGQGDGRQIVETYPYTDEAGTLLFEVVRYSPKDFRQRRPDGRGGWIWNRRGVKPVLYRLPELVAAVAEDSVVYVPEGEKDVNAIVRAGSVSTCNPGGVGKWRDAFTKFFKGATVVVIADRDGPGRKHATAVADAVAEVASSVTVTEPPDGCKDTADLLALGQRLDDLVPVEWWSPPAADEPPVVGNLVLAPPGEPMSVAREFIARRYVDVDGRRRLHSWRNGFWVFDHNHWREIEPAAVRADCYGFTEPALYAHPKNGLVRWAPTRRKVSDLLEAVAAVAHLPERMQPPAWVDTDGPPANELVACANGLLHVPTRQLIPHDPQLFNLVGLNYDYDPEAPVPQQWLDFLHELWPDEPDSVDALQEWFGYVICGRTDLHKIALLVGPTRAGKGVIARVLTALVGRAHVAGPTLASLGTNFGLSPLLGKPLAVISDARLGERTNIASVVERLLSISGEDTLTVDRKYREPWTGQLSTRFVVLSNELPRFGDSSGAVAHRFIVWSLTESFLGRENPRLTDELLTELDGILAWALDGLDRLTIRGHLGEPASSIDVVTSLEDLASPVAAFVRDCCETSPGHEVRVDELFEAWGDWCIRNGHDRRGTKQTFGRDLRAVAASVRVARPRDGETERHRRYVGIALRGTQ